MKEQYKLFAEQYLITQNATKAAIGAGYSEKSAHNQGARLIKKDEVKAYIEVLRAPIKDAAISSTQNILIALEENIRRCMQQVPVTDKLGKQLFIQNEQGERVPVMVNVDTQGANKAIELIGKHLGSFDPDRKLKEDKPQWIGVVFQYGNEELSPDEHKMIMDYRKLKEMAPAA